MTLQPDAFIVIVDEEDLSRSALASALSGQPNWQTAGVSSLKDAVKLAAVRPPELIVFNTGNSDIDAAEATYHFRSSPSTAGVPILHTASGGDWTSNHGVETVENRYATQSVDTSLLITAVSALLHNQALVKEREQLLESERCTRSELEQALHLRDEFLSVASHELKAPLTALKLHLQLMERNVRQAVSGNLAVDQILKSLDPALRQSERVCQMVERLLDVSRIRAARLHLDISAVDLCALLGDCVDRLVPKSLAHETDVRVSACSPVIAYVDLLRIEQVITNLLSNAIKYGLGKPIEASVQASDDEALISVRDHGIGIAPGDQQRIFQRFERATGHERTTSLGLGLYISSQIVEAHAGVIEVESELGSGSTFLVRLPLTRWAKGPMLD